MIWTINSAKPKPMVPANQIKGYRELPCGCLVRGKRILLCHEYGEKIPKKCSVENVAAYERYLLEPTKRREAVTKPKRLTIGMRVRVLTIKELEKKLGKKVKADDYYWNRTDGGKHALLQERSSSGGFSILTIGDKWKNERILPKETTGVIDGGGAWVDEDLMEFVNADFDANLDYMDWYQENEDNFCGDCWAWVGEEGGCSNKKCPGYRWDHGLCPDCGTKLSGKHEDYCKKCKVHMEEMRI